MKRPRSLLWRLGALALAVTMVSLALHIAVIAFWIRPLGDALMRQVSSRAVITRTLMTSTPAAQRVARAAGLGDSQFELTRDVPAELTLAAAPTPTTSQPPPGLDALAGQLGPDFTVLFERTDGWSLPPRRFWFQFDVEGEPWYITVRVQPPVQAVLGTGLGWLLLAVAAVGASLLIGLRFIVHPIREVAQRISDQSGAMQAVPVPSGASVEVRSLVESFNRLADRVRSADRTKQIMLAGVSHDLRTPLARLRLRIETQCEPRVADAADVELRAVEHIVSQFLAFVHGDSSAGLGARSSALRIVDDVVESYARQGVLVRTEIRAPDISVGAVALQRLLSNLIDNALAHGAQPVAVTWTSSGGGSRQIGVWDHGAGMSEAEFRSAQEPFVRLTKRADIGHCGLGLAIVAQIAQQFGASLTCRRDDDGRFGIVVAWDQAPP